MVNYDPRAETCLKQPCDPHSGAHGSLADAQGGPLLGRKPSPSAGVSLLLRAGPLTSWYVFTLHTGLYFSTRVVEPHCVPRCCVCEVIHVVCSFCAVVHDVTMVEWASPFYC